MNRSASIKQALLTKCRQIKIQGFSYSPEQDVILMYAIVTGDSVSWAIS